MDKVFNSLAAASALAAPALAAPTVGQPAPAFTAVDANGKTRSLSEFKGKTVVLEWTNAGCPYVRKHYDSGNMQGLQKSATADGAVWLTVISSAPGTQGYVAGDDAKTWKGKEKAAFSDLLLDPSQDRGLFNPAMLDQLLTDPQGQLTPLRGSKLWQLAALNLWLSEQGL